MPACLAMKSCAVNLPGAYAVIALVTDALYPDTEVVENESYSYVVRAVDLSFNRSGIQMR